MSSEDLLTTDLVEDGYAYNEWDVDAEESQKPRRKGFRLWHAAELAAVERRGAVRALREAAEAMSATKGYELLHDLDGDVYSIGKGNSDVVHDWLLDRAEIIEGNHGE